LGSIKYLTRDERKPHPANKVKNPVWQAEENEKTKSRHKKKKNKGGKEK